MAGTVRKVALAALVLASAGALAAWWAVEHYAVTPRELAPYLEKRSSGHNALIEKTGSKLAALLQRHDRSMVPAAGHEALLDGLVIGAQPEPVEVGRAASVTVAHVDALRAAMVSAVPGTIIELAPGTYRVDGRVLTAVRDGLPEAPIVVRAARPGTVELVSSMGEAVRVSAPWWRFENLTVRGECKRDDVCGHAFHVVGRASHFAAVNNTITGFNAHFKINREGRHFPDHGLIAFNTLSNPAARDTHLPVTPIDLVAASHWTIRANIIRDFSKLRGNRVSYGAFAKGGGSENVFERNLVWCESRLQGQPGQRVGLSLGGGGTGPQFCRDNRCVTEQQGGIVRANLIVGCSDAGIDLNNAAGSVVADNTVIDTAGIVLRDAATSATVHGNLVDGPVRARDGALLRAHGNAQPASIRAYLGSHPVRALFANPAAGDFSWRGKAPLAQADGNNDPDRESARLDLCGGERGPAPAVGAFDDFARCLRRR